MAGPSVFVQTLLGQTVSLPLQFGSCPPSATGNAWQPFIVMDNLVRLNASECGLDLHHYVEGTGANAWYAYNTQKVTETLPLLSYVEYRPDNGEAFVVGNTACTVSLVAQDHTLPGGIGVVELHGADGRVRWQRSSSGLIGTACELSLAKLDAALGFWPNREREAIILPEEEWHAFVSLIFVFLGLVYLLGDIKILDECDTLASLRSGAKDVAWKKFFVLDGPLTALATSASIVVSEVESYAEDWVVGQQIFLLVGVIINFAALFFLLYIDKDQTTKLRDLRMYVDVPIFIAILVPVMHASGNLLELACIIANIMTVYVAQRHYRGDWCKREERNDRSPPHLWMHKSVAIFNIFLLSPAILLTIVHNKVGNIGVRVLVAEALTVGSLAVFTQHWQWTSSTRPCKWRRWSSDRRRRCSRRYGTTLKFAALR